MPEPPLFGYRDEELVLGELLERKAETNRGQTFLRFRENELSYDEFDELVNRTAQGLAAAGVGRRTHVALMLPNGPEFLQVVFALAKLGAVSVPVNTAYKGDLLAHVLHTSDARMLVIDEPWLDRLSGLKERLPQLKRLIVRAESNTAPLPEGPSYEVLRLRSLLDSPARAPEVAVRFGDLQSIIYTSGTTGPSKGVMVPHAHGLSCALDWIRHTQFRSDEVIYCPLPLFHGGGLWDGVFSALLADAQIAIVERFSVSRFWEDARQFQANVALGIFSMIPMLLNRPASPDDKNHPLRCFYLGQSALDGAFAERFGVRSVETYASTEVGVATGSPYGQWRPGSCGRENSATYKVAVVDEQDRERPPGEPGELVIRPVRPYVMTTGYYGFWKETAETFRNLWFHTGDRVYRDRDGYFYFVDRLTDSIRRRGENISSFEVERVVNRHPAVQESAAIAVPSEVAEDEVKVCVVPQPGATPEPEELVAHCREHLPKFMVPRYVEVLDRFPKSAIGKIQKGVLRSRGDRGLTPETWDRDRAGGHFQQGESDPS